MADKKAEKRDQLIDSTLQALGLTHKVTIHDNSKQAHQQPQGDAIRFWIFWTYLLLCTCRVPVWIAKLKHPPLEEQYYAALWLQDFTYFLPGLDANQFRGNILSICFYALSSRAIAWLSRNTDGWRLWVAIIKLESSRETQKFLTSEQCDSFTWRRDLFLRHNLRPMIVVMIVINTCCNFSGYVIFRRSTDPLWVQLYGWGSFVICQLWCNWVCIPYAGVIFIFYLLTYYYLLAFNRINRELQMITKEYYNPKHERLFISFFRRWLTDYVQLVKDLNAVNSAWAWILATHWVCVTAGTAFTISLVLLGTDQSFNSLGVFGLFGCGSFASMTLLSLSAASVLTRAERSKVLLHVVLAGRLVYNARYSQWETFAAKSLPLSVRYTVAATVKRQDIGFKCGDWFLLTNESFMDYLSAFSSLLVLLIGLN